MRATAVLPVFALVFASCSEAEAPPVARNAAGGGGSAGASGSSGGSAGSSRSGSSGAGGRGSGGAQSGSAGAQSGSSGSSGAAGRGGEGGSALPAAGTGSGGRAGAAGRGGAGGSAGAPPRPPDPCIEAGTCPPGVWINVTPPEMDRRTLSPTDNAYGPGTAVVDPARPSDLYIAGGEDGIWKSTDYGNTWTRINDDIPGIAHGDTIAVAGTTPATLWVAAGGNSAQVYKSVDGGESFELIGERGALPSDLYSLQVNPYDDEHLISGLHEADGIAQSFDGGETWELVRGSGFPRGGVSWYPFFIVSDDAEATTNTWFAIAQNGGSGVMTRDGGETWTVLPELEGSQHAHGNAQIFQDGDEIWVPGIGDASARGIFYSPDRGESWTKVNDRYDLAVMWGTPNAVYAMWSWACSNCDLGANFLVAERPGNDFVQRETPEELDIGASHVAVTHDGNHYVFVGTMWARGIWRYVEP